MSDVHPEDDPATRLLRRSALVALIGGFALFDIPPALKGLASGDLSRQIGAVVNVAFWAWLTWRLLVLLRVRGASKDPRYWRTSAVGYAGFFAIYLGFTVWAAAVGQFDALTVPSTVLVLVLAVGALLAFRRAEREASPQR